MSVAIPPTKRKYLSWSQINSYRKCSMLYYLSYILGIKVVPPWVYGFGHSVEGGLNYNFNQKIQTRRDLKLKKVLEAYDFSFESEFQKEEVDWQGENRDKVKDSGVKLVGKYHTERSPLIQPVAVQDKIEVHFKNVSYYLLGILDLVEEDDAIVDYKTSQKTPNRILAVTSEQLTTYSLCFRVKYGRVEKKVMLEYLVSLKEPKLVHLQAERTSEEIDAFLKIVAGVYEGIEKEIFVPCSDMCWWCSKASCGYYPRCKPRRTVIAVEKIEKELEEEKKAEEEQKAKEKAKKEAEKNAKAKAKSKRESSGRGKKRGVSHSPAQG